MNEEVIRVSPEDWEQYYQIFSGFSHEGVGAEEQLGSKCFIHPNLTKGNSIIHHGEERVDSPFSSGEHTDLTVSGKRSHSVYYGAKGEEMIQSDPVSISISEDGWYQSEKFVLPVLKLRFCSLSNYKSYQEITSGPAGSQIIQETVEGLQKAMIKIGESGGYQDPQTLVFINSGWGGSMNRSVQTQPHAHGHAILIDGNPKKADQGIASEKVTKFVNKYATDHEDRIFACEGSDWKSITEFLSAKQATMLIIPKSLLRGDERVKDSIVRNLLESKESSFVVVGASMIEDSGEVLGNASGYLRDEIGKNITIPIIENSFQSS